MTAGAAGAPQPPGHPRIGLALGGGSARGLAHIVVLEALDELGLKPAAIVGTSMGAICGALYAAGLSASTIRAGFADRLASRAAFAGQIAGKLAAGLASLWSVRAPAVIDNVTLFEMVLPDILHCDFAALPIPFAAVAADYYANEQVILDRGPLIPAIAASCALPVWARPVALDGRVLIDGGYVNPVPFDVVMDKADITVAVDVIADTVPHAGAKVPALPRRRRAISGATQMLFRSVMREKLRWSAPDILIRPAVGRFSSLDFFRLGDILAAAEPCKDELKSQLAQRLGAAG
jgi:NTE family protein